MFHNQVTTMLKLVEFLTIQERRQFKSIATSWAVFLTQTHTSLIGVMSGYLWYNSGPFMGMTSTAHSRTNQLLGRSGLPYPWTHIWLPAMCRNDLSGQISERHAFNLDKSSNNGTVLNRHRWGKTCTQYLHALLPLNHHIPSGLHLFIITWLFFMIANIANRDQVSIYIS
jgi:hypothetical protein